MELSSFLSKRNTSDTNISSYDSTNLQPRIHSYSTRHAMAGPNANITDSRLTTPPTTYFNNNNANIQSAHDNNMSPYGSLTPKSVAFELLFPESPQFRARLPMRVQIFPHDTTESIVTTVKNFYGLYAGPGGAKGVSFEDEQGTTLIARYENFRNNMIVYVRVIEETSTITDAYCPPTSQPTSPVMQQGYHPTELQDMLPPQPAQALNYGQLPSRPDSRTSSKRNDSPNGRGRRSTSTSAHVQANKNHRSRSGYKSRGSSTHGSFTDLHSDYMNGYSSGDGAGSVSSRTKSEHLGNTEISLDNIVEGGRRKRAKFESSELPLFAPPQMPAAASNSSVSPARRIEHQRVSLPFPQPSHNPFSQPPLLQSPQGYGSGFGQPGIYSTPAADIRRTRGASYAQPRLPTSAMPNGNNSDILPTPDPTVGSCMSEEDKDVALQLMRLGEMGNISHGRTSASTLDDTFSGRADAASSTGVTSDEESESDNGIPPARRQKLEASPLLLSGPLKKFGKHMDKPLPSHESTDFSGDEGDFEDGNDGTFKPEIQDGFLDNLVQNSKSKIAKARSGSQNMGKPRTNMQGISNKVSKTAKSTRYTHPTKNKNKAPASLGGAHPPMSPTSLPPPSRKASVSSALNFQHQLGDDEEDLSSKPRCQRCRKSKKGCDRQRPCQRCKDAGLTADQCISEDEGNGRKGRYGRHMGVPVKRDDATKVAGYVQLWNATSGTDGIDRSKKRKR